MTNTSLLGMAMIGLRSVSSSFSFIRENGMMKAYIWIVVVMIVLMTTGVSVAGPVRDYVSSIVEKYLINIDWAPWLVSLVGGISGILTWLLAVCVVFLLSGYIALILLSPVFSYLAEKTYRILHGQKVESSPMRLLWGIARGVTISLRNMCMQFGLLLILFFCSFIPVIGIVCPVLMFLVDAFYVGFSMSDYSLEAYNKTIGQSVAYGRRRRGLMVGIGVLYALCAKIPIIGIYIAILIAPACVVGAARVMKDDL